MLTMYTTWVALVLCCAVCSAKYEVPDALVEPLRPKGLRVSIPDHEGITLMAFHGNINVPFDGLEAGEMAKDIIKKRGNRWVFEDKKITLKEGDVIYYWIYVILDGLGYQGLDRSYTVTQKDFIVMEEGFNTINSRPLREYEQSITIKNGVYVRKGALLFHSDFKNGVIDPNDWFHEKQIGGPNLDDEFVVFDKDNCKVVGGTLEIRPTLTADKYSPDFVKHGELTIEGCTSNVEDYCTKAGLASFIIPPVISSRISTKNSFTFQHGMVEIKAKLPQGDWIIPELWLEPKQPGNTGRIVIGLARGNSNLTAYDLDISCKTMTAGAVYNPNRIQMLRKQQSTPWTDSFHIFRLTWIKSRLTFMVDDEEIGRIDSPDPHDEFEPFNTQYYVTLGVHVGGLRDFPDIPEKPWVNSDPKRMVRFWQNKDRWYPTWNQNSALLVEYVKVWAI